MEKQKDKICYRCRNKHINDEGHLYCWLDVDTSKITNKCSVFVSEEEEPRIVLKPFSINKIRLVVTAYLVALFLNLFLSFIIQENTLTALIEFTVTVALSFYFLKGSRVVRNTLISFIAAIIAVSVILAVMDFGSKIFWFLILIVACSAGMIYFLYFDNDVNNFLIKSEEEKNKKLEDRLLNEEKRDNM